MRSIKLKIPLTPKAKESVRLGKWGNHYNPSSRGMKILKDIAIKEMQGQEPLDGPILAIVRYLIPAPASLPLHKKKKLHLSPHAKKPDADNLEKFLNDALRGVVWNDDSRIAWLLRSKLITYEEVGSTEIYVTQISSATTDFDEILDHITNNIRM
jgi:Holliday junction resolvase RusA-like endonuclease